MEKKNWKFQSKCWYHYDREAVTICEHCGKPICKECNSYICPKSKDYRIRENFTYSDRSKLGLMIIYLIFRIPISLLIIIYYIYVLI